MIYPRRSFLKWLLSIPTVLLWPFKKKPTLTVNDIVKAKQSLESLSDKKYFMMFVHPRQHYLLKVITARQKYKDESHQRRLKARFERLGHRPGEDHYSEKPAVGEAGKYNGVNWIRT